jgi:hypothetical protein
MLFAPLLPLLLVGLGLFWLFRRSGRRHPHVAGQPTA